MNYVQVNRLERVLDVREEEQQLPGVLISRRREVPTLPIPYSNHPALQH